MKRIRNSDQKASVFRPGIRQGLERIRVGSESQDDE